MTKPDPTTDPNLKSWVERANRPDCDFSLQNLPYGIFSTRDNPAPRVGVAIGDEVLDLALLESAGLIDSGGEFPVFSKPALNAFMAQGPAAWRRVREQLSALLSQDEKALRDKRKLRSRAFKAQRDVTLHRPFEVRGFTDFYASREHASNVGRIFRGEQEALLPNWLHLPVAYNGRASTVVVSGTDIRRPRGQLLPEGAKAPEFAPSQKLDFELEIGAVVGTGNVMGEPVTLNEAEAMIFGFVLLNDWSARDIQLWEYRPLGPFLGKAFATTISPWVVPKDALEPFRVAGPGQVPAPLAYLCQPGPRNFDIHLEATLRPEGAKTATVLTRTNFRHMYWSCAQQLAHHSSGGCAMQTGDLLGSGTISGPERGSCGSLLELTWNGKSPLTLQSGGTRTFLEDGDSVILTGQANSEGYRVGFGECRGKIFPAN